MNTIIVGDCLLKLKKLAENSVDAIVTDPPYGLEFMGKDWDKGVPGVHFWQEMIRVLKPGGHLLAFGGTRTYHRMASAIEDAGFEVRDMIEWVYGSGFPKSLNIGKAVDKLQGNEREWVGKNPAWRKGNGEGATTSTGWAKPQRPDKDKGTSEWEGWGTALKPAHEPICMARKPLSEKTVAENVLKYGTGGINIDGSRVEGQAQPFGNPTDSENGHLSGKKPTGKWKPKEGQGRFPANLIHDNSEEVRECFPDESERFFKSIIYQAKASKSERNKGCEDMEEQITSDGREKSIDDPFLRGETTRHNNHPTVKPIALMEYLIKMVTHTGGVVLDPFMGSGTTGVACKRLLRDFIGIEMEPEYAEIARRRIDAVVDRLL